MSEAGIHRHKRKEHQWGRFKCPMCPAKIGFAADLVKHMIESGHTEDPLVNCPACQEKLPMKEIEPHYKECVLTELRFKEMKRRQKEQGGNSMDTKAQ